MRRVTAILALGVVLSACQSAAPADAVFDLREFSIAGPDRLSNGLSRLTATNNGEFPHTLVVTANDGTVIAATDLVQPGQTVDLAVDLYPGLFQVSCRIVAQIETGELADHYELGMRRTVEVSPTDS